MSVITCSEKLKELILSNYNTGRIVSISQIGGGTANANFLVSSDAGDFFLRRRNPNYSNEKTLIFDHMLMNHLAVCGICAPFPVKTKDCREWVRIKNGVYELFKYVEGKDYSQENRDQLIQSAITLAKFHTSTSYFNARGLKDWSRYDDPKLIKRGLDIVSKCNGIKEEKLFDYLYLVTKKLEEKIPDHIYWDLPACIIHGDYHPANLKFSNGKVIGVFDLDWATRQPRIRDIVDGILYFAARRKKPINGNNIFSLTQECFIDIKRSKLFINTYRKYTKFTDLELELLPYFMRARWLYSRVSGTRKVRSEAMANYFTNGITTPLFWLDKNEEKFVKLLKQ